MKELKVVCGVIHHQEKIFIARRKEGKSMAGKWEFPGGKIEDGETGEESLTRELLEELGMNVTVGPKIGSITHQYESFSLELIAYHCIFTNATFELTDHDQYEWVIKKDLSIYTFSEADISLMNQFPDHFSSH